MNTVALDPRLLSRENRRLREASLYRGHANQRRARMGADHLAYPAMLRAASSTAALEAEINYRRISKLLPVFDFRLIVVGLTGVDAAMAVMGTQQNHLLYGKSWPGFHQDRRLDSMKLKGDKG